jgi:NADH-quinone oxidoreductase subunit M
MLGAYRKMFFGKLENEENKKLKDLNGKELFALVPLTALVIILGVYPKPILEPIDKSVTALVRLMHEKALTEETKAVIPNIIVLKEVE